MWVSLLNYHSLCIDGSFVWPARKWAAEATKTHPQSRLHSSLDLPFVPLHLKKKISSHAGLGLAHCALSYSICPLFSSPPWGIWSSRIPTPGNFPSKAKKNANAGGRGRGLGAGGIDWCIMSNDSIAREMVYTCWLQNLPKYKSEIDKLRLQWGLM